MTLEQKKQIYRDLFASELGKLVLEDLEKECRYEDTVFNSDPLKMAQLVGKRDVLIYIKQMIKEKENRN